MSMRLAALAALAVAAGLCAPASAMEKGHTRSGLEIGARGAYFKPDRADGAWSPGGVLRIHLGKVWALEGTADFRQQYAGANDAYRITTYPVQASLLAYIFPDSPVTPYVLGGVGWYNQHIRGPGIDNTSDKVGPHAGGGLAVYIGRFWSMDATYRFIWVEADSSTDARLEDKRFNDRGHMITAGLNYHF